MFDIGRFPSSWKVARLVLISRGKSDTKVPSRYSPLNMLDSAGKLLEKLIKPRVADALINAIWFKAGRSTIDAIEEVVQKAKLDEGRSRHCRLVVLLATLNVRKAFNSTSWCLMLETLKNHFNTLV